LGQKILVVEDNELNLKLFCDLLRAHGYEAEPVRDGREAVERTRAFAPELIIMDIQMPHVSGLELIEQIKGDEALRTIPIMAVTAYAAKGDEERIREAGAEGYVSKPISLMRFIEAVAGLLKEREEVPQVNSSAIDRVEHDEESRTLDIWYSGGDRYSYFDVPRERYEALLAAPSLGAFVNSQIKPHYRFELEPGRRRFRPSEEAAGEEEE
jgi:two-component system cell cycle response regulator DivK